MQRSDGLTGSARGACVGRQYGAPWRDAEARLPLEGQTPHAVAHVVVVIGSSQGECRRTAGPRSRALLERLGHGHGRRAPALGVQPFGARDTASLDAAHVRRVRLDFCRQRPDPVRVRRAVVGMRETACSLLAPLARRPQGREASAKRESEGKDQRIRSASADKGLWRGPLVQTRDDEAKVDGGWRVMPR